MEQVRYGPESLLDLNRRLLARRAYLTEQVNKMKPSAGTDIGTGSISDTAADAVKTWGKALKITEWRSCQLQADIHPPAELANAP